MRSIFLSVFLVGFLITLFAMQSNSNNNLFTPKLQHYCDSIANDFDEIDDERKKTLEEISTYLKTTLAEQQKANIMFICTHNSRRSQFGQVWAAVAAKFYDINGINTFSGGIEVTACNSRTIDALARAGFITQKTEESNNPKYKVQTHKGDSAITLFSKLYKDAAPQQKFVAVMVCGDADEKCPLVFGAEERVSLPYTDPKASDNSPQEAATYDERCRQIAREVFYIFSKI